MAKKRNVKRIVKKQKPSATKLDVDCKNDEVKFDPGTTEANTNTAAQFILRKLCRLCEGKDGPFVDIFDAEKTLVKKVDEIMPFVIAENDDLPKKICFRCSAKVEEVYEFVQRCLKTQESFHKAIGKKGMLKKKQYIRSTWENKLSQCNISNDDICNTLIYKALEGIKKIPIMPIEESEEIPVRRALKLIEEESADLVQNKEESYKKVITENSKDLKSSLELTEHYKKNEIDQKVMEVTKSFNIMDHVSKIKVNGVGDLFQCKLCNRNFLVKEVVMNHRCAKNGGKKIAEEEKTIAPVPPKIPLVKYINTKTQNKTIITNDSSKQILNTTPINVDEDDDDDEDDKALQPQPQKSKHRIGPASRVKQFENTSSVPQKSLASQGTSITQQISQATSMSTSAPTVQMPFSANLNSRFKLVPGPNNSFMLVEDKLEQNPVSELLSNNETLVGKINNLQSLTVKSVSKLNSATAIQTANVNQQQPRVSEQPYPVRLIKSGVSDNSLPSSVPQLTTPAMKKQSYTIVQTGNPSKLLISTKSQPAEDVPVKRLRQSTEDNSLSVSSEKPNKQLFTFVNVDPVERPSYVLPTRNVIQESQISTSTIKNAEENYKYPCNICGERFSREKKLQTHIQSHYNQLDEEDQRRGASKKRKYKS